MGVEGGDGDCKGVGEKEEEPDEEDKDIEVCAFDCGEMQWGECE